MQIATHYPPCLAQRYAKEKGIKNLSAILRDENLPLPELLRAGGLVLESGMPNIRDIVTSTVLVEAVDGYRVVFSLAELDPALTDASFSWQTLRTVSRCHPARGLSASSFQVTNSRRAGCAKSSP
ncbi:MAG TPA: hypothetical protein VE860_22075 [Chthoniobacterales bacterium]|nr:hypothetical protein [Chthoniobacterales bacterium]